MTDAAAPDPSRGTRGAQLHGRLGIGTRRPWTVRLCAGPRRGRRGPQRYLAIAATDPARLTTVAPVPSTRDQAAKGASVT